MRPIRYIVALTLASVTFARVAWWPERLPRPTTPTIVTAVPRLAVPDADDALLEMDADLLRNLALGEDPRAVRAVIWVALNRAGCDAAPDFLRCERPIVEAVTEGRAFGTWRGGTWSPSWVRIRQHTEVEGDVYAVLLGYVPDPTDGADHFHRRGTWTPPWAPSPAVWALHGSHWFYRVGS